MLLTFSVSVSFAPEPTQPRGNNSRLLTFVCTVLCLRLKLNSFQHVFGEVCALQSCIKIHKDRRLYLSYIIHTSHNMKTTKISLQFDPPQSQEP